MTFEAWMADVDAELERLVDMRHDEMMDADWAARWEGGESAEEAARDVVRGMVADEWF